ncbi:hypothetical protein [Pseudidiomarina insulisalsae]|uniref:ABM domain-containing protein n=1 Tax=Pseudidiomarina insulisalsae TaxID=575789 RepID=A0A432YAB8_9GAMM|nr:hypothetical protein [Pseudidiomarina insulisalsae]RUO57918.1 hypothetical protein CWI71_10945 [Pseudidiomarina insulisalsae]
MQKLPFLLTLMAFAMGYYPSTASADNHEDDAKFYLSMSEVQVKLGHSTAFLDAVKAWKSCYEGAGGTSPWNIWRRLQGESNTFVLTSSHKNWQAFFAEDEASKACESVAREQIVPHMEKACFHVASFIPEWSDSSDASSSYVAVYNFKVRDYRLFDSTVEAIEKAIDDDGGTDAFWYYGMGGRDQADYFVVETFADTAALDADDPGVWKRLEAAVGEEKKNKLQSDFMKSVDEWWSYLYIRLEEVSYSGAE